MKFKVTEEMKIAARESREHWKRMAKHVELTKSYDQHEMEIRLGETYDGEYCALCILSEKTVGNPRNICQVCPLAHIGEGCNRYRSIWREACKSRSAKDWLNKAASMVTALEMIETTDEIESVYDEQGYDKNGYDTYGCDKNKRWEGWRNKKTLDI